MFCYQEPPSEASYVLLRRGIVMPTVRIETAVKCYAESSQTQISAAHEKSRRDFIRVGFLID